MNKMRKQKLGYILYSIRGLIILKSISILQYKGKVVKFNLKEWTDFVLCRAFIIKLLIWTEGI